MDIYRMEASPLPPPQPDDPDAEPLTLQLIVEACEDERFNAAKADLTQFGRLTSWISYKLSLASLDAGGNGDEGFAARLGLAGLEVARSVGDSQQVFSNLLDQTQLLVTFGHLDEAIETLLQIVNSLSPSADHARPTAHISLAGIYRMRQRVHDALYHLERGLRYSHSSLTPEQRQLLLAQFMPLYGQVKDLAGLAHCARQVGKPELADLVLDQISPKTSRNEAVFLTSRLRALDEHDLADAVYATWKGQA